MNITVSGLTSYTAGRGGGEIGPTKSSMLIWTHKMRGYQIPSGDVQKSNLNNRQLRELNTEDGCYLATDNPYHHPQQDLSSVFDQAHVTPGLHIVAMIVSTVANMFPTLSQAILIHVNTLIGTSQASPDCNQLFSFF